MTNFAYFYWVLPSIFLRYVKSFANLDFMSSFSIFNIAILIIRSHFYNVYKSS